MGISLDMAFGSGRGVGVLFVWIGLIMSPLLHAQGLPAGGVTPSSGLRAPADQQDHAVEIVGDVVQEAEGPCQSAKPNGSPVFGMAALGAVAGGVLGAAVGGSGRAITGGAVAGALVGGALGSTQRNNRPGNLSAHDRKICDLLIAEESQLASSVNQLVDTGGPQCGINKADAQATLPGALSSLSSCMEQSGNGATDAMATSALQHMQVVNQTTCKEISRVFTMDGRSQSPNNVLVVFQSLANVPSCSLVSSSDVSAKPQPSGLLFEQTLAAISSYTYQIGKVATLPNIDSFTLFGLPVSGSDSFVAVVFRNGHRFVIAFRGTEKDFLDTKIGPMLVTVPDKPFVDNLLADATWLKYSPLTALSLGSLVKQAVGVLIKSNDAILKEDAKAQIVLTGHSLGGAIALMLGKQSHLPVIAFDAPGAGAILRDVFNSEIPELQTAAFRLQSLKFVPFKNSGISENIRLLGDKVSTFGEPIGATCTVFEPIGNLSLLERHSIDYLESLVGNASIKRVPYFTNDQDVFAADESCPAVIN